MSTAEGRFLLDRYENTNANDAKQRFRIIFAFLASAIMKTKAQKAKEIKQGKELLEKSGSLVFADFTGIGIEKINKLKSDLRKSSSVFKVIKKRLLRIVFKEKGIDFDPKQFDSQLGVVFIPGELIGAASIIYKFAKDLLKEKKEFKLLGAYEIPQKLFLNAEQFLAIAKLPSREVLLAQLVQVLAGPIRAFMYIFQERAKKVAS